MPQEERPETPEQIAKATAIAFTHFYRAQTKPGDVAELTANTFLLRQTGRELGLDLLSRADVQYCADYLGDALARIDNGEPVAREPVAPEPSYDEKVAEHRARLKSSDPVTLRKISLVQTLRNSGYTAPQISVELRARNFSPLTQTEAALLAPPTPTESDVQAGQKSAGDEVSAASARIGQLLGRGPVSAADIKGLPNDVIRKLLWPHGAGSRKDSSVENDLDVVLRGGR